MSGTEKNLINPLTRYELEMEKAAQELVTCCYG